MQTNRSVIIPILAIALCVRSVFAVDGNPDKARVERTKPKITLEYLLNTPTEELIAILPTLDIAEVNLACAEGLPGSEALNKDQCLSTLAKWATQIQDETVRHIHQFYRNPAHFNYSLADYKIMTMITVLQQDLGVGYNTDLINSGALYDLESTRFFSDSKDIFLHGLVGTERKGSCSSIPVLVVALGRRLGYPLKLVSAKAHLFARWEDNSERFNIEATGRGFAAHSDDHYRKWPYPFTAEEEKREEYLVPYTPQEELAGFLSTRVVCLMEHKRYDEALQVTLKAQSLRPKSARWALYIVELKRLLSQRK